jgi:NOL1/NOP2/fmu family ribosome biogenesis protein
MRKQFNFLNTREVKKLITAIKEQFGIDNLSIDYYFLKNKKGKINIISKNLGKISTDSMNVNSIGMYLGKDDNGIRLSIEGSQIIGSLATKNIIELDNDQVEKWVRGDDIEVKMQFNGYVIVKNNGDYYGSGRYKDSKILNFVPKERRIKNRF